MSTNVNLTAQHIWDQGLAFTEIKDESFDLDWDFWLSWENLHYKQTSNDYFVHLFAEIANHLLLKAFGKMLRSGAFIET